MTCHLCVQIKVSNGSLKNHPARGTLTVAQIDRTEVPAFTSFSHEPLTWWGSRAAAEADKEAKSLWRRVDKDQLPDKAIALPFPGAPGCASAWQAHMESFVAAYNSGELPQHFLHLGKWPEDISNMHVYPGLLRMAKQQRVVLRAPRHITCTRRMWVAGWACGAQGRHSQPPSCREPSPRWAGPRVGVNQLMWVG